MKSRCLFLFERGDELRRMNLRAPQTLIRINIANPSQKALIEKQRFDSRAPGSRLLHKFFNPNFQRIGAERAQLFREGPCRQIGKTPETPRIRIAQLAIIVEQETSVSMFFA